MSTAALAGFAPQTHMESMERQGSGATIMLVLSHSNRALEDSMGFSFMGPFWIRVRLRPADQRISCQHTGVAPPALKFTCTLHWHVFIIFTIKSLYCQIFVFKSVFGRKRTIGITNLEPDGVHCLKARAAAVLVKVAVCSGVVGSGNTAAA